MEVSFNQPVELPLLKEKEITLHVKREDLLHPVISGNKFRKLKYNILEAKRLNKTTLLTFGGAYSNHIVATAGAGKEYGFETIGIIRGNELGNDLEKTLKENPTLQTAYGFGMKFDFIDRQTYREKSSVVFLKEIQEKYPNAYILPEGGTNDLAIKGCEEILLPEDEYFTHIACAMGTGGTVTGIINATHKRQNILVFPSLKGNWVEREITSLRPNKLNWNVISDFHFGGYGKVSEDLINFVNSFKSETGIPLDPVYTGKMMYGLFQMIQNNEIPKGSKVLAIHTGGLQGIQGMNQKLKSINKTLFI